jgi:hypothetical protein
MIVHLPLDGLAGYAGREMGVYFDYISSGLGN